MSQRRPIEHLVSAGGVVCRIGDNGPEVVLCGRRAPPVWALPKGTPEAGETRERTAVREVTEETGLEVEINGFIDSIQYWFVRPPDGARCHKTVYYFLMSATGGGLSRHDREFDEVRWFPADQTTERMKYDDEARVVEKGLSMASQKGRSGAAW